MKMSIVKIPYGNQTFDIICTLEKSSVEIFIPGLTYKPLPTPSAAVANAINSPVDKNTILEHCTSTTSVGITINDKTRPVPNTLLLTPLLHKLKALGIENSAITIFIASGTHVPMKPEEYQLILSQEIINTIQISAHNSDDETQLCEIGKTFRGTPVFVNKEFFHKDLKIVVGDIELHHFAGYSGGVKSAAIGLAGRQTINHNHKLLLDNQSILGNYAHNPLRNDIEEIGELMGINLALNAVLNERKEIVKVFFGKPRDVIKAGIKVVNDISQVPIESLYDLVVASAGGYPKDINLYQAQKAMTHASLFCKPAGKIILIAECIEGVGSDGYLEFMRNVDSAEEVIKKFEENEFSVGPHKAFQIARLLTKHQIFFYSSISTSLTKSLLLNPLSSVREIDDLINNTISSGGRVAILPYATACIPKLTDRCNDHD